MATVSMRELRVVRAGPVALLVVLSSALGGQETPIRGFPRDMVVSRLPLERVARDNPDPLRIRSYMRAMTKEPHSAGTAGSRRVAEWALAQFRSWGLDASIEQYEALIPMPIEQVLEIRGKQPWRARLEEEVFAEDPDSRLPGIMPPYAAYGKDGDISAPLIYANYALAEDFAQLEKMGIDAKGKIILARAGPHNRAVKVSQVVARGGLGLIMYNDPREDGYWLGRTYPRGPMRPPQSVERGAVRDDLGGAGDPLSPGWASTLGSRRLAFSDVKGLPAIPVMSISYGDATALFEALEGPVVPSDSWKGALGIAYMVGPSTLNVHMKVRSEWTSRPLYDVIARIPGAVHPDQWVITGNHHDAWVYGADDPVGAAASLMEAARTLAGLRKSGWQPDRTIIFALWDGEELGDLGSTEWVEQHEEELKDKAVIYLNGDNYRRGYLTASGSSSLETFMREVARDTRDPSTGKSALDIALGRALSAARTPADSAAVRERPLALTPIGMNTDYGPFIQHMGITSLHIAYRNTGRGTYHSAFDSFAYFERFLDPDFSYGKSQSGAFASALLRLADAPVLPWSFVDQARAYRGWIQELVTLARSQQQGVSVASLVAQADSLQSAANAYETALSRLMTRGSAVFTRNATQMGAINHDIAQSERALLFTDGLPGRPWTKYPISGGSSLTGAVARTFPVLREALEQRDVPLAQAQVQATTAALQRLAGRVAQLAARLDALQ